MAEGCDINDKLSIQMTCIIAIRARSFLVLYLSSSMATKTNTRSNIPSAEVKANFAAGFQPLSEVALFRRSLQHSTVLDSEAPRFALPVCFSRVSKF